MPLTSDAKRRNLPAQPQTAVAIVIQGDGICRHSSCRLLTKPPLVTISVCGTDLPPLQGYNRWGELPRLKPGLSFQGPSGRHADTPTRRHAGSAGNVGSQPLATCNFDAMRPLSG